jgi:uncharacterized membrane protein
MAGFLTPTVLWSELMSSQAQVLQLGIPTQTGVFWLIKRNCAMAPAQLCMAFALLCGLSLSVAMFFWWMGAVLVLPFAALELLALGVAFLVYARHATDGERIHLAAHTLVIERESAGQVERHEFARSGLQVLPARSKGLVELSASGRVLSVGRFLRPEQRRQLAKEIRWAMMTH